MFKRSFRLKRNVLVWIDALRSQESKDAFVFTIHESVSQEFAFVDVMFLKYLRSFLLFLFATTQTTNFKLGLLPLLDHLRFARDLAYLPINLLRRMIILVSTVANGNYDQRKRK